MKSGIGMRKLYLLIAFFTITSSHIFSQEFLDEMQLVDISNQADIKSTIIRDPKQALLIVKTQIPGIRFQSNNIIKKIDEIEPGIYHIYVSPGTHRMVFQADGFISNKQRFYFNPKDVKGIQIRVVPAAEKKKERNVGYIVIKSEPDSAEIYINDQFYGLTPYVGKMVSGRYNIKIKKEMFIPYEEEIVMIPGETLPLNINFYQKLGKIKVITTPAGASIYIDDEYVGNAPNEISKLYIGKHKLKITHDGYKDFTTQFEISKDAQSLSFDIPLILKKSKLSVIGNPLDAKVTVDNNEVGALPVKNVSIGFGTHLVKVQKKGFEIEFKTTQEFISSSVQRARQIKSSTQELVI